MLRLLFILFLFPPALVNAQTLNMESGPQRKTLVELYTSEGCSSCPPAEEFLNQFKTRADLWKKWVPVALHVDYWDYIGWKDRYAKKEFGQRQSVYARLKQARTVYTPAFMVNGNSWRPGWFNKSLPVEKENAGKLKVAVTGGTLIASYHPEVKTRFPLKLNVALLGMDLSTVISRGENEGRTAKHEFVVVGFNSTTSSTRTWKQDLPKLHYQGAKKYALAVWVSTLDNPAPLQAVGSFFPSYKAPAISDQ